MDLFFYFNSFSAIALKAMVSTALLWGYLNTPVALSNDSQTYPACIVPSDLAKINRACERETEKQKARRLVSEGKNQP